MRIIDLVDDKIVIKPEALCISPFREIWESDKSKDKKSATDKIRYIWFYTDYDSPYKKNIPLDKRGPMIIRDTIKDKSFKVDQQLTDAIAKYDELYTTPEMRLIDGANTMVNRMDTFFRETEIDGENIKKATDSIIAMPKLVQALKDARRAAEAEKDSGTKVRGNAELGMFE
jgi:hypothetical protein